MKKSIHIAIILLLFTLFSFKTNERKRIIVIGDSISLGYGSELKIMLENVFDYSTKNTNADAGNLDFPVGPNAGDSRMVLNYLRTLKADKNFRADLMLLNCGLHDIKTDRNTIKKAIDSKQYTLNLDTIFRLLRKMKQPVIWVNTTTVNDSIHNSKNVGFYRYKTDVIRYNQIADSLCLKYKIPVINLYSYTKTFPDSSYIDHVHYKPEYAKLQAAYIAGFIANIKMKKQ